MKKLNYLFGAALVAFAATFASCSNDDNAVEPTPQPAEPVYEALFTYDFAAAAVAGENPENVNGSAANGHALYAWENDSKVDSKRQDYKGYKWAEGSVLPEECHVWRRSDRINGNIVEGGLKYGNDRDTAIDGLEAGNIVEIFYEGETPAVWVAAIQTLEDGTTAPRATALINGEEAVSGVTTIASGDKIEVKSAEVADNGTGGYIVLNIKKGTILSKVVISKEVK